MKLDTMRYILLTYQVAIEQATMKCNRDLEALLAPNIDANCQAFALSDFVELDRFSYIVHF